MSFSGILIANRGEVAVRVVRACRELGIRSAAVFSEADAGAMHRRLADESHFIGPPPTAESYLNVERIVGAVRASGAEAVHPGYGFLSESAAFARAVEASGAVWIGPPPDAMELVGDKVRAKELARRAGVPTVPGYDGDDRGEDRLIEEAARIGYPVLVKAAAGGGGRGMRAVHRPDDFAEAVRGAKREAEAAFGDGSVFLEKMIQAPRHVEVQVIGDHHGNVVHLFERECSIQRRHQKVIEEAPSPALNPDLRQEICAAAVRLARAAGYRNAGTVEFLLDESGFYFLEVNARLQVEHPVTELVTGLDLVGLQISISAGEPLSLRQEDVSCRGAAVEARLYAEDANGLPAGGRLHAFDPPAGPGIRNDAGVETGDDVPLDYDPMLSKLVVSAPDRPAAVHRLRSALSDHDVLGVPTNLPLLRRIAAHPAFAAGETTTAFLEEHRISEPPPQPPAPRRALLLVATAEVTRRPPAGDPYEAGPWRLLGAVRLRYESAGETREVSVERARGGRLALRLDDEESQVEVLYAGDAEIRVILDGSPLAARISFEPDHVGVAVDGDAHRLTRPSPPAVEDAVSSTTGAASLVAPMPGTVVRVLVAEGDEVEEGRLLLVLEAMKMEQPVAAPRAGRISSLPFAEGSLVPGGAVLVELEESPQDPPGKH